MASGLENLPWKQSPKTADMRAELSERSLKPFTDEELMGFSKIFNELLEVLLPGVDRSRTWLTLFKQMDDDDSGQVRFDELADLGWIGHQTDQRVGHLEPQDPSNRTEARDGARLSETSVLRRFLSVRV